MTQGIGLEEAGVELTKRNKVVVDKKFKTTADGIYAIGDIIDGPMLAHKVRRCQAFLLGQLTSHTLSLCPVRDKPLLPQVHSSASRLRAGRQEYKALCGSLACLHRGVSAALPEGRLDQVAKSVPPALLSNLLIPAQASSMSGLQPVHAPLYVLTRLISKLGIPAEQTLSHPEIASVCTASLACEPPCGW